MREAAIYIHVPFCLKKCNYCDFNSVARQDREEWKRYFQALEKDWEFNAKSLAGCRIKSIYLGGGTPSLVPVESLSRLLKRIKKDITASPGLEITLEMNPAACSQNKLRKYRSAGINRISLGVQSFDDKLLGVLGRVHSAADSFKTIARLRKERFDNISIDLIYGIPGQSLGQWQDSLEKFISLGLEHISFYDLKIEKGTPFYRMRDKLEVADEKLQLKMYKAGRNKLRNNGLEHYEISSFAREGRESIHNRTYWRNEEYLGLGAGAYSYVNGERFCRIKDIRAYIAQAKIGELKRYSREKLTGFRKLKETLILNLRLMEGFSLAQIEDKCGCSAGKEIKRKLEMLVREGLLKKNRSRYCLSSRGILLYDSIAAELL